MVTMIECAGFIESSCDDGPGVRSVLFLQGCSKNCYKCHNANIKEHGKGKTMSICDLVSFIDSKCCNKKITISGGEPLEQLESLCILVKILKEKGYNICIYTGWDLGNIPQQIFLFIDYIKTGSFVDKLRNTNIQYVGSSNQHMYEVNGGVLKEMCLIC